jgi:hypothetical protein
VDRQFLQDKRLAKLKRSGQYEPRDPIQTSLFYVFTVQISPFPFPDKMARGFRLHRGVSRRARFQFRSFLAGCVKDTAAMGVLVVDG